MAIISDALPMSLANSQWLSEFSSKYGRKPRVLHIGNIANNAYLNAKILDAAGFDCDVICYDYYHIMGCPEWEDAKLTSDYGNDFSPNWSHAGIKDFQRPRWFAQGPVLLCIEYLRQRRKGNRLAANLLYYIIGLYNKTVCLPHLLDFKCIRRLARPMLGLRPSRRTILGLTSLQSSISFASRLSDSETVRFCIVLFILPVGLFLRVFAFLIRPFRNTKSPREDLGLQLSSLCADYSRLFPERSDSLYRDDFKGYLPHIPSWQRLFKSYDLIHAYSTDPVLPLLAGKPYVAFEHGTIRHIPYQATSQGRLCALSYRLSNWTAVTNADNLASAGRLGIPHYTFVPHPVNEASIGLPLAGAQLRARLMRTLNSRFIIFHPARQHWSDERHPDWEKGNDVLIYGFARFVQEVENTASLVLVEWGASVEATRALISQLGISKNVAWVRPMPHRQMVDYIYASDIIADQFYLGAFGSILPKALACGRVSMLYLNPDIHTGCFEELPPVLNTKTPCDVLQNLSFAFKNNAEITRMQESGKAWYQKYHSNAAIANSLSSIYSHVLSDNPPQCR